MVPIKYHLRNLFVRRGTTLMTLASIGFVVLVYIGVLSLAGGLRAAFAESGDPATLVVLREGALSESPSVISTEHYRLLKSLPGVMTTDSGEPLASGETLTLQILKRADGTESNISVRGVDQAAFLLRPQIEIVDGRRFDPGKNEIIVGDRLARRFPALALGQTIELGRLDFLVVGIFAGDGAYTSEVWGDTKDFGNAFRREQYVSSVRLKTASPEQAKALRTAIKNDNRLAVDTVFEPEYFLQQSEQTSTQFIYLGNALAVLMGFGACFAAANTMYAQVAARGREIGTLRALGFRRRSIVGGFLLEAIAIGLLAGGFGALLSLPLNAISTGTVNAVTFSEVTFALRTTPLAIFAGVFLATVTGVIGGLLPAWSASRQKITNLLHEA